MNRCKKWNNAFAGISNFLDKKGFKLNNSNMKIEARIVNTYCKRHKIKGSFSERILLITDNFESFKQYINTITK